MKVAVLSESPADEAAVRILVEGILGRQTQLPSLVLETQRATEEAKRLAQDLSTLEQLFPAGFGSLARDVRNW